VRLVIGVACLLVLILEAAVVLRPAAGPAVRGRSTGEVFQETLRAKKPEIVLLGNSLLLDSTDASIFTTLSGRRTVIVGHGGAASAWWYLALKNVILEAPQKPRLVVVFLRDRDLTDPGFRVTGEYQHDIDEMATSHEPVLEELAYQGTMSTPTYLLYRHCSLYQQRLAIKQRLNARIRDKIVPVLTGRPGSADRAIQRMFRDQNLDPALLTMRQLAAESRQMSETGDFYGQLDRSFLPHMLRLAQDKGVRIAVVRMKRRRDTTPNRELPALRTYVEDLESYLTQNQAPFIDLTQEAEITLDLYAAGDHLRATPTVRRQFTRLLAKRLAPVLSTLPSP